MQRKIRRKKDEAPDLGGIGLFWIIAVHRRFFT
jgi:hypothetical protein